MLPLKFNRRQTALIVVAHPDDETIWMGGTIARYKNIKWTIFSLCRQRDPDRAPKFFKVCRRYNAQAIMNDLEDEGKLGLVESIPIIKKLVMDNLTNKKFDLIFTHGANGEYGHARHKGVHQAVFCLIKAKILHPKAVFCFNYKKTSERKFSPLIYKGDSDAIVKLSGAEFKKKKKVMADLYGFDPKGIDAGYCTNPEAFKVFTFDKFKVLI